MPDDKELSIRLTVDGKDFVGSLRRADKELDKLRQTTGKGEAAAKDYTAATTRSGKALGRQAAQTRKASAATRGQARASKEAAAAISMVNAVRKVALSICPVHYTAMPPEGATIRA